MRLFRRISCIDVIGKIWMPPVTCAMRYDLDDWAVRRIFDEAPEDPYNREAVESYLMMHSGDFQSIQDFRYTISDAQGRDADGDWKDEESDCIFSECMYGQEA